jgi:hypothetical protein
MKLSNLTFLLVNLLYLVVVLLIIAQAVTFTGEGGLASLVIGVPTLGMLLITLGSQFLPVASKRPAGNTAEEVPADVAPWSAAVPIIGWTGLLFLLIFLAGFQISTPLYTFLFLKLHGKVFWVKSLIVAVALWLLIYVSFDLLLLKPLFGGIFFGAVLPLL